MVFLVSVVVIVLLVKRRRHRRSVLAGLDSTRPTFTLAPPTRWVTTSKDHRL